MMMMQMVIQSFVKSSITVGLKVQALARWAALVRFGNAVNDVECVQCKSRPSVKEWKSMEEGPVYKNDNTLREYQLEGLNWLLFCYHSRYCLVVL